MRAFLLTALLLVTTMSIIVWIAMNTNGTNEPHATIDCDKNNDSISKSHQEYLLQHGWHIKSSCGAIKQVIEYYPERIQSLQSAGLNLEPYNHKGIEANIITYLLKEKQQTGDKLTATIVEIDGELVGGYGGLENWIPGIFNLSEKNRLVEEGIIESNSF